MCIYIYIYMHILFVYMYNIYIYIYVSVGGIPVSLAPGGSPRDGASCFLEWDLGAYDHLCPGIPALKPPSLPSAPHMPTFTIRAAGWWAPGPSRAAGPRQSPSASEGGRSKAKWTSSRTWSGKLGAHLISGQEQEQPSTEPTRKHE